jgi:SnoaL-like domain
MSNQEAARRSPEHPFRRAIEDGDAAAVERLLASDVVLHSPVLHAPFVGREVVAGLFSLLLSTFANPRYTDEFPAASKRALVFRAEIGDLEVEGVQLLRLNQDGLIGDVTILLRPMSASMAVAEAIGPRVEKLPDGTHGLKPAGAGR